MNAKFVANFSLNSLALKGMSWLILEENLSNMIFVASLKASENTEVSVIRWAKSDFNAESTFSFEK